MTPQDAATLVWAYFVVGLIPLRICRCKLHKWDEHEWPLTYARKGISSFTLVGFWICWPLCVVMLLVGPLLRKAVGEDKCHPAPPASNPASPSTATHERAPG